VTDVVGWQSTTVAGIGDTVTYRCSVSLYGDISPRIDSHVAQLIPERRRHRRSVADDGDEPRTPYVEVSTRIYQVPKTVSANCSIRDHVAGGTVGWRSTLITVSCQYKTLPTFI